MYSNLRMWKEANEIQSKLGKTLADGVGKEIVKKQIESEVERGNLTGAA